MEKKKTNIKLTILENNTVKILITKKKEYFANLLILLFRKLAIKQLKPYNLIMKTFQEWKKYKRIDMNWYIKRYKEYKIKKTSHELLLLFV